MKPIDEFLSELSCLDVKLWADGDCLRYRAPKETLTLDLLAQLRECKAEILAFLHKANAATCSNLPPLLPAPRDKDFPLSFAQQRLWFLDQLEPNSSAYNIPAAYRLTGVLNIAALQESLNEILYRHEVLRTTLPSVNGQPNQAIAPTITLTLPITDLREHPETEREAIAQQIATQEAQQPFNLAQEPLFRAKLLHLSETEYVLLLNMHHIISDGWSFNVFFQELAALYRAFSTDKPSPLPELPIQYADFAHWQREWLQGEVLESQLNYWKQQLGGSLPILQLPTDYPRPPVQTYPGAYQSLELSLDLTEALKALSQQQGVTLFMTLLAAFQTLLYRYSGQEDIIVGTPIAGRNQVETEGLIGLFVNTLAIRTNLSGNPSFRQLLSQVREVTLGAIDHQDLRLEKLIEELKPERDLSRSPLFQVMFVFQNTPSLPWKLPGLTITPLEVHSGTSKFDLTLALKETSEGIKGRIEYNTDLFEATTITRMLGHFQTLLEGILVNPDQRLWDLPLLTAAEQHQLLVSNQQQKTTTDELRCFLKQKLPDYMVPSAFVFLDTLPLTPNGKIDQRALPAPDRLKQEPASTFVPPSDDLEIQLTKIWENVLGKKLIGVKDNFFDLGGHSLLAVRLLAQIEKAFGKNLPLATLFQAPNIEELANILRQKGWSAPWQTLVAIQPRGSKPPLFCIHPIGGNVLCYHTLAHYLGEQQPVYGLQAVGLDGKQAPYKRVEDMAAHYIREIRASEPEGPYLLAGHSSAGIVAFEMAQQLVAQGQKVAVLALLDASSSQLSVHDPSLGRTLYINLRNLFRLRPKDKLAYIKQRAVWLHGRITRKITEIFNLCMGHPPTEDSHPYALVTEAFSQAIRDYVPQVYPGQATLFRTRHQLTGVYYDPQFGWGSLVVGGLEIHDVPGLHLTMLTEPCVQVLGEKLRGCIDEALQDVLEGNSSEPKKSTTEVEYQTNFLNQERG